ncbi:MAG: coproporphyrinogen III oxidase family protein [Gammaproteobacteria bacterium]|nr:coproporphyrinogen III oxidase family protein [Gammaproteobacteria bacterium]NNJ84752.1 coproporphyrinogen III oxidase family protein [Gammaproteobacteria bacterium]
MTKPENFRQKENTMSETTVIDIDRIDTALGAAPRIAYTAPHVYPHAAPMFEPAPGMERDRVKHPYMRLYAHIPFCNYACTFCCYAKRVNAKREEMERYVAALIKELEWMPEGMPLSQLFVGGGTPTALPPDLLDRVLSAIFTRMPLYGEPIHTVEASPDSISDEHISVLKDNGIGRVSMGIQSLSDGVLEAVSRRHGEQIGLDACERVIAAGLILNIDLMYGLPGQSEESLRRDIENAADMGVPTFTAYSLRLNEYTPVSRSIAPDETLNIERLMRWRAVLRDAAAEFGYTQTRWHTFKRLDSAAARHERLACTDEEMSGFQLGIGLSSRSHLGYKVYRNDSRIRPYMEAIEQGKSPVTEVFPLAEEDRIIQFVARSIGDGTPLDRDVYSRTFGRSIDTDYREVLARLSDADLIEDDGKRIQLSETGKLVYDLVTLAFYPPRAQKWLNEELAAFGF